MKLIGSRLVLVRAVLESVGPEGDDFIVMCVSGSSGSGWYVAPHLCIYPKLKRLAGMLAEKNAWFILFVIGRLLRNPSWVITQ